MFHFLQKRIRQNTNPYWQFGKAIKYKYQKLSSEKTSNSPLRSYFSEFHEPFMAYYSRYL